MGATEQKDFIQAVKKELLMTAVEVYNSNIPVFN
jgi:hypothetical protein